MLFKFIARTKSGPVNPCHYTGKLIVSVLSLGEVEEVSVLFYRLPSTHFYWLLTSLKKQTGIRVQCNTE